MQISDQIFTGERPLYESRDMELRRITIGEGESGLKESRRIMAESCEFEGLYVLWECEDVDCLKCHFAASDRAPLWYGRNIRLTDCLIDAPKAFRELDNLTLQNCLLTNAVESFWFCRDGQLTDLQMHKAEYAFFQSERLKINHLRLKGKYAFQYARNIEIHDAVLDTKDAFWESRDCVVYDSEINGEYLGWYAKNLRLVRCHISGTQPLCYCENLVLEDCTFAPDADLAFEKSSVQATIIGKVASIKNPIPGSSIRELPH
jgi:hypothetical protein